MQGAIGEAAKERIAERLSSVDNLYFPRAAVSSASTPPERKSVLLDLLSRDAAVFLERYGAQLTCDELLEFDVLNDDYEVSWHLKNLRSKMSPTSAEVRSRSVTVKNRRLAYLERLIREGKYFSEEAMREREPYLHHEFVGKFQDQSARGMARPGERWSETLMRRSEEALLVSEIRKEQRRLGVDEREWVGDATNVQEEEEEEEEEEDEEEEEEQGQDNEAKRNHLDQRSMQLSGESSLASSSREQLNTEAIMSEHEMADKMDQFTYVMHQKFLSGEDHQHLDYSKIDDDETLDDHWTREANHDAEDRNFNTSWSIQSLKFLVSALVESLFLTLQPIPGLLLVFKKLAASSG